MFAESVREKREEEIAKIGDEDGPGESEAESSESEDIIYDAKGDALATDSSGSDADGTDRPRKKQHQSMRLPLVDSQSSTLPTEVNSSTPPGNIDTSTPE